MAVTLFLPCRYVATPTFSPAVCCGRRMAAISRAFRISSFAVLVSMTGKFEEVRNLGLGQRFDIPKGTGHEQDLGGMLKTFETVVGVIGVSTESD